jgi:hypothetical protein
VSASADEGRTAFRGRTAFQTRTAESFGRETPSDVETHAGVDNVVRFTPERLRVSVLRRDNGVSSANDSVVPI